MSGEWHEAARAMKAANPERSNASIARELGVTDSAMWRALNPDAYKASTKNTNARRGPAKRTWEKQMRATCSCCGGPCGPGTLRVDGTTRRLVGEVCQACRTVRRVDLVVQMWDLRRNEALLNTEIAARLDVSVYLVATELSRLRTLGYDVPAAPYRNAKAGYGTVIDRAAETLGRELRARGIYPTRQIPTTDEDG